MKMSELEQIKLNLTLDSFFDSFGEIFASPSKARPTTTEFQCSLPHASAAYKKGSARYDGYVAILVLAGLLVAICCISQCFEVWERRQKKLLASDRNWSGSVSGGRSEGAPLLKQTPVMGRSNQKNWPVWRKWLRAFCPEESLRRLLERTPTQALSGLDGLRSFSMIWIILANTSLLMANVGTDDKDALEDDLYKSLPQQFTLGSSLAVDTFFFLSGLLTTYTLLRRMRKKGDTSFPAFMFFVLRYLRLTPLYAFILFFYAFVGPSLASGPVWYRMHRDTELCMKHWWSNLIYANNFYPSGFHQTCMSWSWYLANDMQFFMIGLVLLSIYLHRPVLGVVLTGMLALAGIVTGWLLLLAHRNQTQDDYYDKPYTRITPFCIGVLLGIFLVDRVTICGLKVGKWQEWQFTELSSRLLMLLSLGTIASVVYVDFINFQHHWADAKGDFSDEANAAYQSLGRLGFAFAISLLTILCVTHHGGLANKFLTISIWEPLGKLTYGVYLVHPIVIRAYYYQKTVLFHFDVFEQAMVFIAVTVLSYTVAMILHVVVELPFANLTKLIYPANRGESMGMAVWTLMAIPIAAGQFGVGSAYSDECPAASGLPSWMLAMGTVNLLFALRSPIAKVFLAVLHLAIRISPSPDARMKFFKVVSIFVGIGWFVCYWFGVALIGRCGGACLKDHASNHESHPAGCNKELIYFSYVSISMQTLIGLAAIWNDSLRPRYSKRF